MNQQPVQVYQEAENSFYRELLDHDRFLEDYEHKLRGEVLKTVVEKDTDGQELVKQVWIQVYPAKMNDYGINNVISFLRTICDKINALTDLSEEKISQFGYVNIQDFTDRLVENWYEYVFRSISDLNEIDDVGKNLIWMQLNRSIDGQTLVALTAKMSINENRQYDQKPNDPNQQQAGLPFSLRTPFKIGVR